MLGVLGKALTINAPLLHSALFWIIIIIIIIIIINCSFPLWKAGRFFLVDCCSLHLLFQGIFALKHELQNKKSIPVESDLISFPSVDHLVGYSFCLLCTHSLDNLYGRPRFSYCVDVGQPLSFLTTPLNT